jgi:hypothetical protein
MVIVIIIIVSNESVPDACRLRLSEATKDRDDALTDVEYPG